MSNFTDWSNESNAPRWPSTRSAGPLRRKNHASPAGVSTMATRVRFGGFPSEFYSGYGPLPAGYETRKHLYNLYHLLNHLNLFGGGYLAQVTATLRLLADAL